MIRNNILIAHLEIKSPFVNNIMSIDYSESNNRIFIMVVVLINRYFFCEIVFTEKSLFDESGTVRKLLNLELF